MWNTDTGLRFPVAERFLSINGEGRKAGELSAFIRFRGCNLRCNFCDTQWAWGPGESELLSVRELTDWVKETGVRNVTLTGGEPLLQENVRELMEALIREPELEVEIETNGSVSLEPFAGLSERVSFTMDLKCPGSGMAEHNRLENIPLLKQGDVIKFVVSHREDLDWTREKIREYRLTDRCLVYISSAFGRITPAEMAEYMKEHIGDYGMNRVRLQLQLHKYIWDPMKKGV